MQSDGYFNMEGSMSGNTQHEFDANSIRNKLVSEKSGYSGFKAQLSKAKLVKPTELQNKLEEMLKKQQANE